MFRLGLPAEPSTTFDDAAACKRYRQGLSLLWSRVQVTSGSTESHANYSVFIREYVSPIGCSAWTFCGALWAVENFLHTGPFKPHPVLVFNFFWSIAVTPPVGAASSFNRGFLFGHANHSLQKSIKTLPFFWTILSSWGATLEPKGPVRERPHLSTSVSECCHWLFRCGPAALLAEWLLGRQSGPKPRWAAAWLC